MTREEYEAVMDKEVLRVMEIMDDHGYEICDHVDFNFCHQFVKVETQNQGRIHTWIWAVPKRENFKAVLKWFLAGTRFYGVTAYMAYDGPEKDGYRRIPTFYSVGDLERNYDEYFTDGWTPAQRKREYIDYWPEDDGEDYCPSATAGDYGPGCPWKAPGMSIRDFI